MKQLPDSHIRKAIRQQINDLVVLNPITNSNITVKNYDTEAPSNANKDYYILISSQDNNYDLLTKCEYTWSHFVLLDVVTVFKAKQNNRFLLADTIANEVLQRVENLSLPVESTLEIQRQRIQSINSNSLQTQQKNVYRKLIRISFVIN